MVTAYVGALFDALGQVRWQREVIFRSMSVPECLCDAHDAHQLHLELNLTQAVKHLRSVAQRVRKIHHWVILTSLNSSSISTVILPQVLNELVLGLRGLLEDLLLHGLLEAREKGLQIVRLLAD